MTEGVLPKSPVTLAQLAAILPDAVLVGDGSVSVTDLVHPLMLRSPEEMVLIIDPGALAVLQAGVARAAIIAEEIVPVVPQGALAGYITVKRAKHALAYLLKVFEKPVYVAEGVHPTAVIESGAKVHPSVKIGAYTVISAGATVDEGTVLMPHVTLGGNVKVGKNCLLYPGVRLGDRVMVGNNVIIHNNASIGADGFSFVTPSEGSVEAAKSGATGKVSAQNTEIIRINSIGTVILEDNVEVGACTCIDRSTLGATIIRRNTKIDNLVQIGHNNTVGENCLIVSQVGLAGSCKIGDRVVIAGQAGFADHITVGDDAIVAAKSGVMRDIPEKAIMGGIPAQPAKETMRNWSLINKLGDMRKEMRALEKRLAELERQLETAKDTERTPV